MLTSTQIRQSFLDFFREKKHTIVPSSSLMPDSPNLLFTNAGMNQFVPIFLGERAADVSKWAGAVPSSDTRAADTQKCIRAGGKHNDLDDVGLDTYHHTFFEMLGNWSFGDYFKKEAIEWAWELIVERWKFPAQRLYATIYNPDKSIGDPAERDEEAWNFWAEKFRSKGLDPAVHIVNGNKKDNFWMMGETGPCGPCSELHVDLTPAGDTKGALVNKGTAECIEIWNLVFIQFNANPDGTFTPLPAQHVDTGMGFERVTSIIQGTKNFTDFANAKISNYETDIFRPIFDEIEKLSGKTYGCTLPQSGSTGDTAQEKEDVAFRVIADHIRTLSFAIADGIQPGNNDRNYVLRRILRRAVKYGRTLGFHEPFFYKLVDILARTMGDVFPNIRERLQFVKDTLKREEEAFNKTLDKGTELFVRLVDLEKALSTLVETTKPAVSRLTDLVDENAGSTLSLWYKNAEVDVKILSRAYKRFWQSGMKDVFVNMMSSEERHLYDTEGDMSEIFETYVKTDVNSITDDALQRRFIELLLIWEKANSSTAKQLGTIRGVAAFSLYDTYGFPLDLTELMARERGLKVDVAGFEGEMEKQRTRARSAQKREIILVSDVAADIATEFIGYEWPLECAANIISLTGKDDYNLIVVDRSPLYAEMGGQVGDTGWIDLAEGRLPVLNTTKTGRAFMLKTPRYFPFTNNSPKELVGFEFKEPVPIRIGVDAARRHAIERHHTVTHLLHWALHEVVSKDATQKGSSVAPDKLTFDFNSAALSPEQVRDIERLVNERILENAPVVWNEVPYADVRGRADIMQFFGDKYGETVRVVDIGGYSKELCAGTHTRATGEIGLFRIASEAAIAAGVRRIEAVAGLSAYDSALNDAARLHAFAAKIGAPLSDLEKKLDAVLAQQKELEKTLKSAQQREAAGRAKSLLASAENNAIVANLGDLDGDSVMHIAEALKGSFPGIVVLGAASGGAVTLIASVGKEFQSKVQAGKIIQTIAPIVGGKGGGKPDFARGGGKDASKLAEALTAAKAMI